MNKTFETAKEKMKSVSSYLIQEYSSISAGRANPAVLDKITVDYYGAASPINQVAAVSVPEARVILIQPWDASILSGIEKAIQKSDLGINPQNDGKCIRLIFPQLTEERRKEIVKEVSSLAENAKIAARNVRRDVIDKLKNLKKTSEITEDDMKKGEKKIQTLTDECCNEIEKICSEKVAKILEI